MFTKEEELAFLQAYAKYLSYQVHLCDRRYAELTDGGRLEATFATGQSSSNFSPSFPPLAAPTQVIKGMLPPGRYNALLSRVEVGDDDRVTLHWNISGTDKVIQDGFGFTNPKLAWKREALGKVGYNVETPQHLTEGVGGKTSIAVEHNEVNGKTYYRIGGYRRAS